MTFYPRLWPGIFVARYNDREDAFKAEGGGGVYEFALLSRYTYTYTIYRHV